MKTSSAKDTQQIARDLANNFSSGVIALTGNLGAGKTTFVQGFAKALGIKEQIISPTFVLIKKYPIPNKNQFFYHLDLYRLEDDNQLQSIGLEEILDERQNIILIEWAEKAEEYLPQNLTYIDIKNLGENSRLITINKK